MLLFDFIDAQILTCYQGLVNLSNKITGGGEEHIRLAKLGCLTDFLVFRMIWSLVLTKWIRSEDYQIASVTFYLLVPVYLLRLIIVISQIRCAEKQITNTAIAQIFGVYLSRLFGLMGTITISGVILVFLWPQKLALAWCLLLGAAVHFIWLNSPPYFLSCVPPPRQKSLFAKFKESLVINPAPQPVRIPIRYCSTR